MEPSAESTPFALPHGRYAILALGAWLIVSAFSWPHPPPSRAITAIFGLVIVVAELSTLRTIPARWIDRSAAVGLVILSVPHARLSVATALNNVVVAIAVMLLSFAAEREEWTRERVHRH